jgi:AcrR family transcriptional regulator
MSPEDTEAKTRILKTVVKLLETVDKPENLTTRQIAKRAGVGVGLINYHFHSKENLLQQAATTMAGDLAGQWQSTLDASIADPVDRLKALLKANASVGARYAKLARLIILHELLEGSFGVPLILVPVLREIFGPAKPEAEVRLLAFTLVTALQVILIRERDFRQYSGLNLLEAAQRDKAIDSLVNQIISGGKL